MFDPNAPLPDFAAQNADIERQRMMAAALRKNSAPAPQSQMVGKQLVNPSWLQFLPGLLDKAQASYVDQQAAEANKQHTEDVKAVQENWTSSLPRTVAALPGRVALPGPPDVNGSPELAPREAVPAKLPDRDAILKATLAGLQIPGNKDAAMLWNKGMGDDLVREDTQAARSEEGKLRRDAATADVKARLEQARMKLEQEAKQGIDNNETKLEIARLMAEARKYGSDTMRGIAELKIGATGDKPAKPVPDKIIATLRDAQNKSDFTAQAASTFKPEFGGMGGLAKSTMGTWLGGNTEAANWWKDYAKNTQLIERHAMFGSALTASEKSAWRDADIAPGMSPRLIQENLTKRQALSSKMYGRMRDQYSKSGYNVDDAFPAEGVAPAAAPAGVTRTIGGKTYIQKNGQWFEQ